MMHQNDYFPTLIFDHFNISDFHYPLQTLANELIESQVNPTFRSRLMNALQSLITSNNLSSTLDRLNYQRFRKNLHSFLLDVRGILRIVQYMMQPATECQSLKTIVFAQVGVFRWYSSLSIMTTKPQALNFAKPTKSTPKVDDWFLHLRRWLWSLMHND